MRQRVQCLGLCFVLVGVFGGARASAQASLGNSPSFDPALAAEFDSYVDDALDVFGVPGAAVALIAGGEVVHEHACGVRGGREAQPVDLDTRFMIGSISKSMTATLAATLVDSRSLDWDTPAARLLPGFELSNPAYTPLVRIRELLSHSSGVARYDTALYMKALAPLELVSAVSRYPLSGQPRQTWDYQNQMFALGGFAAVHAAGYRYADRSLESGFAKLVHDRVFYPLGMARTTPDFDVAIAERDHASPHTFDPLLDGVVDVPLGFERFATPIAPGGAIWSSIRDMARYAVMQAREGLSADGRRVVSEASLLETHTAQVAVSADVGYGFGWLVADVNGLKVLTHDGGTSGFTSRVLILPDLDLGLVILTNRWGAGAFQNAVQDYALDLLLGNGASDDSQAIAEEQALRAQLVAVAAATAPVTRASVAAYLGEYELGASVRYRDSELILKTEFGEFPTRAVPGLDGVYLGVHNVGALMVGQFTTDERGQVTLTVGIPDIENERILQPFTLKKREHVRSGGPCRDSTRDLARLRELLHGRGASVPKLERPFDANAVRDVRRRFQR
ncbi:MAG TPA: serine hydrolase domain-containing protein [Polyangiaceae bacterium]|nr:serine hydrolase domain-containing protein [Polyangiaceae bacterium]